MPLNAQRVFTATAMEAYRLAALRNYAEAEELLAKALDLREAGHALLDRAATLAGQYASAEERHEAAVEVAYRDTYDDILW
jgi:tetratricopeptide (TPR) repeat protein